MYDALLAHGKPSSGSAFLFVSAAMYYVYMLRMKDGRIYVGHSNNPPRRKGEHDRGKGCRTTGIFGAGEVIYVDAGYHTAGLMGSLPSAEA